MSLLDDHSTLPRHDPPNWKDRAKRRKLTLMVAAISAGVALIVAWDVLVGKEWLASYVLQHVPDVAQMSMSVMLGVGSGWTVYGALVGHQPFTRKRLCRLDTISTEMWGWGMQFGGGAVILTPMWAYHRPGSWISLYIMTLLALGCALKTVDLMLLGRNLRRKLANQQKADQDLEYVRGTRDVS